MKSNYLLIYFLLISSFGFSQNLDIKGVIREAGTNSPLPGASIKVSGGNVFTTSDFDGSFTLKGIAKGETVTFSFLGYKSFVYTVNANQNNLEVYLKEDKNSLDEVVVLGYNTKKKRDLTGAVVVLSSKTIDQLKPIKVEQALQGTISGVNVTAQSGAPGANLNIKIRGIATNTNTDAVALIDGVFGNLSQLNPDDIESITVLKDAQAAIYGTIGANGIVIVTTKQGKKNSKTKFSFNTYTGVQETTKKLSLLNATEYALLLNESYANGGQPSPFPNVSGLGKGVDWQDQVLKTAPITNSDFNISGGSDKITYSLSGSDLKQNGIVGGDKTGFKRNTARLSLGVDLSSKFKLQSNTFYTYTNNSSINDFGLGSVLFNALNVPATQPIYDSNGNFSVVPSTTGLGIEIINPLTQLENTYNEYISKAINGNIKLTYDVIKDLKLTTRVGYLNSNRSERVFNKLFNYGTGKVFNVTRSSVSQNTRSDNNYTFDLFLEYEKTLAENHKVKLTLGTTAYKAFGSGLFATGFDVPNNSWEFADINLARGTSLAGGRDVGAYAYDDRRLSQFAFLDYSFKNRYLISGTIRRDLSSIFGPNNRVGIFPAVTAGWVVSDEEFIKKSNFFNFLKIRASYGILGNDQIGSNRYVGTLGGEATYIFNGSLVNGTATGVLPNPNIQWEEAEKLDIGFDLKLLNEKIDITADYFDESRNNLLIPNAPVSGITGVYAPGSGSPTINAGTVNNKGIEFSINYKDKLSESANFSLGFNVTHLKNEVTEVKNANKFIEAGGFGVGQPAAVRMEEGFPLGYFYGYQTDGIFQNQDEVNAHPSQAALGSTVTQPGDIRYKDLNGDGVINQSDRTNIGSAIADYTLGFNVNFNYKNLDFVAYSYASIGNDMVRNYERVLSDVNRGNYVLGRWTGEGTSNSVPRVTTGPTNNNVLSSYFVEDASFLRIQNIQLGYTINKKFTEKAGISKVRLYASVNNLYTFTKYRGFDPAASTGASPDRPGESTLGFGIDNGFYPTPRIYIFGLNLIF
jgi:TonB-dependent starch-binding outer membrane protein SusC